MIYKVLSYITFFIKTRKDDLILWIEIKGMGDG